MLAIKPKPVKSKSMKPIFYDTIDYETIKKEREKRLQLLEQQIKQIKNIYYPY